MQPVFECVLDVKASLGECPVWSVDEQVLYWVDINAPSLNRFDPLTGRNTAWPMPSSIGCFALRERGGFIAALRDGFWLVDPSGKPERKVVDAPYDPAHHRFNDGRADARGRLWAGSMNEKRDASSAKLYRLDPDFSLTAMISELMISNGLAWSPDGRTLYHADTPTRTVSAWDFEAETGAIANRRTFVHFAGEADRPDGAAVDREGCYWSALYRGGKLARISPRGELVVEFALPAMCPTMCAFGGPDLKTLFVTTARQQREPAELARLPQSGGLFAARVDVPGLAEPKFAG
ncbi:MAG TPA: SMP-30/gluconolactonase/LRE family protein [Casimicrobiaceae bacterium]